MGQHNTNHVWPYEKLKEEISELKKQLSDQEKIKEGMQITIDNLIFNKGEETLIKWIRENWIVGTGDFWRRQSDTRDQRTDSALLKEYTIFLTQKQKV